MVSAASWRVVVDTNVVFEGLTQRGGASALLLDAWLGDLLEVCVSNALAYEYADVLARKLSSQRWNRLRPVLGALLANASFVTVYYSWRPIGPDPGDEFVIDCAMNAGSIVVTGNVKHFKLAQETLGLNVCTPLELVALLANE